MQKEKVWLITGTSSGLGRAIAECALKNGYRVVATARKLEAVGDLVEQFAGSSLAVRLDVTNPADVKTAVSATIAEFGRIDVLVNNAGYGLAGAIEEPSDEQIRQQFETNLFGAVNMMRAVLPQMRIQRGGHIVNISSVLGFAAFGSVGYLSATKFAIEGLSEALAQEAARHGIRVTIVEPGPFRTKFAGDSLQLPANQMPSEYPSTTSFIQYTKKMNGRQEGDPRKAAEAILRVVESENPPLRLPLGEKAITRIEQKLASVQAELAAWREIALNTAFDDELAIKSGAM